MTNTEKHTPGPWETSVNGEGQWDVCEEGGGDMIADLAGCPKNAEANAKLIARAPALLAQNKRLREALENILSQYEGVYDCTDNHGKLYQSQGARDAELAARAALNEKE